MKKLALCCLLFSAGVFALCAQTANTAAPASRLNFSPTPPSILGTSPSGMSIPMLPGSPSRSTGGVNPSAPTPQEWQELNAARAAALKDNPALLQKAQELSIKMRDFQQKLDAAIVEVDPNTASLVTRIEHGIPGQHPPIPLQGQHPGVPTYPTTPTATPSH